MLVLCFTNSFIVSIAFYLYSNIISTVCCYMFSLLVVWFYCLFYVSTACYMFPLLVICFHCLIYISTACYMFPLLVISFPLLVICFHCLLYVSTACYIFPLLVICFHCLLYVSTACYMFPLLVITQSGCTISWGLWERTDWRCTHDTSRVTETLVTCAREICITATTEGVWGIWGRCKRRIEWREVWGGCKISGITWNTNDWNLYNIK